MVVSNGVFVCSSGGNDDGGEKGGVFVGHELQNQTKIDSLNPNSGVENGVFRCHEAANKRIRLTPKENDKQVPMAEILLNLRPIGLKLQNLVDLMNTIEKHVNYTNHQARITHHPNNYHAKVDEHYCQQQMTEKEKLKASNFTATLLRIGSWERVTRNEGDLVAKCYYAKKKLVWEFLERGLKSKIEIQWTDIMAMRADIQENQPGILEIELSKPPTFHEETDPQPRKHTIWRLTTDFTGGEASKWRRHYLMFPPGSLDKHYEKLLQCDNRLLALSNQRFPSLKSPIFDSNSYGFPGFSLDFNGRGGVHMNHPGIQWPFPRFPQPDYVHNQLHCQSFMKPTRPSFHETPSPISVMDFSHSDELGGGNNVFDNSRMALWGGNGGYQGLQTTTYNQHRRPDQTFAMNQVQGLQSTVISSTSQLDRNVSYTQNYNLFPYDQAIGTSKVELLNELQELLLSDTSQLGVHENNYHLARVASLNALLNLAKEDEVETKTESDQTLYGVQDLSFEDNLGLSSIEYASDQVGSGFGQFYDQQQQMVPYNMSCQVSPEDTMPFLNHLHGNAFNGVNQ